MSSLGMVRCQLSSPQKDRGGFEELAMPLFDSIFNFARWLARNQIEAADLVQETYLKALRGYAWFAPGTNFRGWIFRILKNTFLDSCAKLDRRMTIAVESEEDLPPTAATPESLLLGRVDINAVQGAIQQLPIIFREVLLLCDVEDASYRETAEILSIPIGTVMYVWPEHVSMLRASLCNHHAAPSSCRGRLERAL